MAVNLALLILVVYINKYLLQNAAFKTWFIQRLYSFYVTFVKWRGYEHHSILACLLWKVNFFFPLSLHHRRNWLGFSVLHLV